MRMLRLVLMSFVLPTAASAHGGGLNADGCHHDRKAGGYHCHRATNAKPKPPASPTASPNPARCSTSSQRAPARLFCGTQGWDLHHHQERPEELQRLLTAELSTGVMPVARLA